MKTRKLSCRINGAGVAIDVRVGATLLEVLRDDLRLTGTKEGCAKGECGACTVMFDGAPITACLILGLQAEGHEIVTIEGLAAHWADRTGLGAGAELHPVQSAFLDAGAVQCGFCTPGLIMSAAALIEQIESPSEEDIKRGLEGNLCRCTGYTRVYDAVQRASGEASRQPQRIAERKAKSS